MERIMQHVWQHRMGLPCLLTTVDGEEVEIIDPGLLNSDAGPDFFNAKIRIGNRIWAGNVEIHVKASDWIRHNHHKDPAYQSVILHVVRTSDTRIAVADGRILPQLEMTWADAFCEEVRKMSCRSASMPPCADELPGIPSIFKTEWLAALGIERLNAKVQRVHRYLQSQEQNWHSAIYVLLARALGFSTNGEAFERTALATPLRFLMRHQGDARAVEAALFGQSGMLDVNLSPGPEADYLEELRNDYAFMKAKYGFNAPVAPGWRMARMRPQNFPHRRIAFLAAHIAAGFTISRNIFNVGNVDEARQLLDCTLSPFWASHYNFTSPGRTSGTLSRSSIDSLLINVAIPVVFAYGKHFAQPRLCETAVDMLHALPPENNVIIRNFAAAGIEADNAYATQALLELYRSYCEQKKCLYCRLGHRLLAEKARASCAFEPENGSLNSAF